MLRYQWRMNGSPDQNTGEGFAEFVLPQGCMLCGGAVNIRKTPGGGAHSYCPHCHWLSRPRLRMREDGLELSFGTNAFA
jgi:hypothetical protein